MAVQKRSAKRKTPPKKKSASSKPQLSAAKRKALDDHRHLGPLARNKYDEKYVEIARTMCRLGATDADLADAFGVCTMTISNWQARYEDFAEAVQVGKDICDARVERSLYQRAVGYTYSSEKVFCQMGEVVRAPTLEHVPPDVGAAKSWLNNRRPDQWAESRRHELVGKDGGPIEVSDSRSEIEIARRVAFMLARASRQRDADVIEHD